jgi:hypothetical protein
MPIIAAIIHIGSLHSAIDLIIREHVWGAYRLFGRFLGEQEVVMDNTYG